MNFKHTAAALTLGLALATQASAAALVDNGPDTGIDAFTINTGFSVTNAFTLTAPATLTRALFSNWLSPGDTASSVDWAITTLNFGGVVEASGTGASLSSSSPVTNGYGFSVYTQTIDLGGVALGAGTYWLQLSNLNVTNGAAGFWGVSGTSTTDAYQNDGSSVYPLNSLDPLSHSNAFQINPSTVPEPATLSLMGLAGLGFLRRRKALAA